MRMQLFLLLSSQNNSVVAYFVHHLSTDCVSLLLSSATEQLIVFFLGRHHWKLHISHKKRHFTDIFRFPIRSHSLSTRFTKDILF